MKEPEYVKPTLALLLAMVVLLCIMAGFTLQRVAELSKEVAQLRASQLAGSAEAKAWPTGASE